MVLNNDDAECRHGVRPTYKKKKGFQPLQMNWGRYFVDAVFRGGNKHFNHGDTVEKMIRHMVNKIRKFYRKDVPIIIRIDIGVGAEVGATYVSAPVINHHTMGEHTGSPLPAVGHGLKP